MLVDQLIFNKHLTRGEKISYAVRKHWTTLAKPLLEVAFFGFLIPWMLYFMAFRSDLFFWLALGWSAIAYLRFLYLMLDWYADAWLFTDRSMIIVQFNGIFNNVAGRIGYEDIEGLTYAIRGFWGTVLRYGDLTLRVMSGNNFNMPRADRPNKAELAIARLQGQYLNDREMQDAGNLKNMLASMIATQMKNRSK